MPHKSLRISEACRLKICVESAADIRYTATSDAQGPLHNLQIEALSPFSTRLASDDLVGNSLSVPNHVVAGARARSYLCRAATNPVVPPIPGGLFLPWTVSGGVDRIGRRSVHGQCEPRGYEQNF